MRSLILVVGSGIAGTCAALSAALESPSSKVFLASKGPLFSGSSFFEGTWGLGLIAPDGTTDQEDLAATIEQVGCGAADPALVRSFVRGIAPAIAQLEAWGVTLKHASGTAAAQREYIPCFDHKHRAWHGIEREPYVQAMDARLQEAGVTLRQGWELMDFDPKTRCALFFDSNTQAFEQVEYDALVLCTGGTSSLFSRHLTQDDCCATVQGLAASRGCQLINMAFMQFMPGIVSPVQGVVFNEKAFRFMQLPQSGIDALGGAAEAARLLDMRSGYGPFTCRLESRAVDFAIHQAGPDGLELTPHFPTVDVPEFVTTYQQWLQESAGVGPNDALRVALYAHASNGGIAIDQQGCTSVPGVFAAGECTGGMHGADRLGGLSSANGLVFGMRAGKSAAEHAACHAQDRPHADLPAWTNFACSLAPEIEKQLQAIMDESCMIVREKSQVETAKKKLAVLAEDLENNLVPTVSAAQAAATRTAQLRLMTAQAMVSAILEEEESRGSHYWA